MKLKYRKKYANENLLDRYILTNPLIGESLPFIGKSLKEFMQKEDIIFLESLDDIVTIYRGTSLKEFCSPFYELGQSWTLSKRVASFFAFSYGNKKDISDRCVMSATIKKEFILGYISEREEYECIIDIVGLKNTELLKEIILENVCKE